MWPGLEESGSDARESRPGSHRRGYRKENTSASGGECEGVRDLGRNIPDGFPKGFQSISSDAYSIRFLSPKMTRPVVIVTGASRFDFITQTDTSGIG